MRRVLTPMVLGALVGLGACSEPPAAPTTMGNQQPATTPAVSFATAATTADLTGRYIVTLKGQGSGSLAARVAALGGTVDWISPGAGLATVSGLDANGAAALAGSTGIAAVDIDEALPLEDPGVASVPEAADPTPASPAAPATAFFFPRQWNMRAVQADAAWAAGNLGSPSVSVFILDSGIDYLHLDLAGLVDLSRSVDMLGTFNVGGVPFTERDTVAKYFPSRLPFTDLFFHGTHVAATVSSNAVAAAGVTSRTTLVAVKVCAYLNTCPTSSILAGVVYAAENGADVINMSLGGSFAKAGNGRFVGLFNQVFNYARSKGVTIVVSAGNSAIDLDHDGNGYKTYCSTPATVCVAATGPTYRGSVNGPFLDVDAPAYYTNFGSSAINVAAPGGNSGPPVPPPASGDNFVYAACSGSSLIIPVCQTGTFVVGVQGTSMASPHVAGTAALLVGQLGRNPGAIRARLQSSADDLGKPGTDPYYGKGRLNVARAVGALP
ncbi:MAG: S8 family serine peptidase [Gemmatimonadales bacterium]